MCLELGGRRKGCKVSIFARLAFLDFYSRQEVVFKGKKVIMNLGILNNHSLCIELRCCFFRAHESLVGK